MTLFNVLQLSPISFKINSRFLNIANKYTQFQLGNSFLYFKRYLFIFWVCECLYTCIYISCMSSANGGHNKVLYVLKLELQAVMKGLVGNGPQIYVLCNNSRLCQPQRYLYSISYDICNPLLGHFPQSLVICHFLLSSFFPHWQFLIFSTWISLYSCLPLISSAIY